MLLAKRNSTMEKATDLISSLLRREKCHFANQSMYNSHIMDLPLSSFMFQFFLLRMQGVNLQLYSLASHWL